jgi:hypothetical protein
MASSTSPDASFGTSFDDLAYGGLGSTDRDLRVFCDDCHGEVWICSSQQKLNNRHADVACPDCGGLNVSNELSRAFIISRVVNAAPSENDPLSADDDGMDERAATTLMSNLLSQYIPLQQMHNDEGLGVQALMARLFDDADFGDASTPPTATAFLTRLSEHTRIMYAHLLNNIYLRVDSPTSVVAVPSSSASSTVTSGVSGRHNEFVLADSTIGTRLYEDSSPSTSSSTTMPTTTTTTTTSPTTAVDESLADDADTTPAAPSVRTIVSGPLIVHDPVHGDAAMDARAAAGCIIVMRRGVVSFADKARCAAAAGAAALLVIQSDGGDFPFCMTDSTSDARVALPVVMVSHADGEALIRSLSAATSPPIVSIISRYRAVCCPVCTEDFVAGVEAVRLPCHHHYHRECIKPWLQKRSTCPLCRFQLPTDTLPEMSLGGAPPRHAGVDRMFG